MVEYHLVWITRILLIILSGETGIRLIGWSVRLNRVQERRPIGILGAGFVYTGLFILFVFQFVVERHGLGSDFMVIVRLFVNSFVNLGLVFQLIRAWQFDLNWTNRNISRAIIFRISAAIIMGLLISY